MSKIEQLVQRVASQKITLRSWLAGFAGVLFIRFLLENFSSPSHTGLLIVELSTLLHYSLFYAVTLISVILWLRLLTKINLLTLTKLGLFGLPIIWLAPVIDLIFSRGTGFNMAYIFAPPLPLLKNFFTFFGPLMTSGVTIGIRLEISVLLLGVFIFVADGTRSTWRALAAAFGCYAITYFWVAIPSFVFLINDLTNGVNLTLGDYQVVWNFFTTTQKSSLLATKILPSATMLTSIAADSRWWQEITFNYSISQIFYAALTILLFIWAWGRNKEQLISVLKNSRPERIVHYFFMIIMGMSVAFATTKPTIQWNWLDLTSLCITFLAFYFAWLYAVSVNDIVDVDIDAISNTHRPLVMHKLSIQDFQNYNVFFLCWALIGGWLTGYYNFFLICVFTAAYYIYSAPPLRLKRLPFVATFLIGIASLGAVMTGFFLVSADQRLTAFGLSLAILIVISLTLAANIKDIKDIEGDRQNNIKTLPVIFGAERGKKIIAILVALAYLLVPLFLHLPELLILALTVALVTYFYITKTKKFNELGIFVIYYLFVVSSLIILKF